MTALLAATAYGLLGVALSVSNGFYHPVGLVLVLGVLALSIVALRAPWPDAAADSAVRWLGWALGAVVALGLAGLLARRPGISVPRETSLAAYRAGLVVAGLLCLGYAAPSRRAPRLRFPLIAAVYVALGIWVIAAAPSPGIDVLHFQERAAQLLLAGENPFTAYYVNLYGGTGLYGSGYLRDGRIYSITYPPLPLLLGIPGWLLGDVRLSLLAAVAGTAVLMVATARRLGAPPGHRAELAAVALLFHPRGFFLIEQAWIEPYMALGAAAVAWALAARSGRAIPLMLAFYVNTKQYACFWLPLLLAGRRVGWRQVLAAGAIGSIVIVPFLAWSPEGFWRGVFLAQITTPLRIDALSVPAAVARATGVALPAVLGFAAAGLVAAYAVRSRQGRPGEDALGAAAMYLAFFAFNKQASLNYYWLVGAFLLLAAGAAMAGSPSGASPSRSAGGGRAPGGLTSP